MTAVMHELVDEFAGEERQRALLQPNDVEQHEREHARAIRRLRDALGELNPQEQVEVRKALVAFAAAAAVKAARDQKKPATPAVVLPYKPAAKRQLAPVAMKLRHPQAIAAAR